jgi:anaerobic magnesium-protoporphyrin IX monomethyl ester cyclase
MGSTRVALVNPRDSIVPVEDYAVYENLGLAMLSSYLSSHGHDVVIIDGYAENLDHTEVVARAAAADPRLVGFTCTYQSYGDARAIAESLRQRLPDAHFTLGGEHATYAADFIFGETDCFDSVVRGEGELTLLELARAIESGSGLGEILGLWYREGRTIARNPDRPAIPHIDSLPFAARDTLAQFADQDRPILIGMIASRGCVSHCNFCNANEFFRLGGGRVVRRRSPENIVAEMEQLYTRYVRELLDRGVDVELYFYDATFVTKDRPSKAWAREIAQRLVDAGVRIPFRCFARADSFSDDDDDLINLLKKAGLVSVFVGFEAAGDAPLNQLDKGVKAQDNWAAVRLLRRHSLLGVTNGFIMFSPHATFAELRENAAFLLQANQASYWNLTQRVQLFPGVKLLSVLERDGLLLNNNGAPEVLGYRFRDPRVGILADALDWNDHPLIRRENSFVRYVRNTLNHMIRLLEERPGTEVHIQSGRRSVEAACSSIEALNVTAFDQFLTIAESGWNEDVFQSTRNHYLGALEDALEHLECAFRKFLDDLDPGTVGGYN